MGSKNNWTAGETATRSKMNEPFFMQSGQITATNVLSVRLSPGSIRFPYSPTLRIAGTTHVAASGVVANRSYTLFVSPLGDFAWSGHDGFGALPVGSPVVGGEPLGTVSVGSSVNTTRLVGPWNTTASGHQEPRAYAALRAVRPRMQESQTLLTGAGVNTAVLRSLAVLSPASMGVGQTLATLTIGEPVGAYSIVHAAIVWAPSGALQPYFGTPSGMLSVGVQLAVIRGAFVDGAVVDSRQFVRHQNPDDPSGTGLAICTTPLTYVSPASGTGALTALTLEGSLNANATSSNVGVRVKSISFFVEPGRARSTT